LENRNIAFGEKYKKHLAEGDISFLK
jgi:hypothetical protein